MKTIAKYFYRFCASAGALAILTSTAFATTFTAADTFGRSALATFEASGGNLTVTLTNTSTADVTSPAFVLTALFFGGANGLTPVSALLAPGSTVFNGPDGGGNVGGEWAYESGLYNAPHAATAGISSSGLSPSGFFGHPNFNGANLTDNVALGGVQYGITSANDNLATPGVGALARNALIKNSVVFTLSGLAGDFNTDDVTNVSFQYGTSINDANIPSESEVPVPEPGTLLLVSAGVFAFAIYGKRRQGQQ